MRQLVIVFFSLLLYSGLLAAARPENDTLVFENEHIRVRLIPRSPDQIAAFYEARKFPDSMISRLRMACFITVGIQNKSDDILWLELENWSFTSAGKSIKRYHRKEWRPVWQALNIPMASQSTFRWTLLPEQLDFRPGEREGGNIILQRTSQPLSLRAHFQRGKNRQGKPVDIRLDNITCAGDQS